MTFSVSWNCELFREQHKIVVAFSMKSLVYFCCVYLKFFLPLYLLVRQHLIALVKHISQPSLVIFELSQYNPIYRYIFLVGSGCMYLSILHCQYEEQGKVSVIFLFYLLCAVTVRTLIDLLADSFCCFHFNAQIVYSWKNNTNCYYVKDKTKRES